MVSDVAQSEEREDALDLYRDFAHTGPGTLAGRLMRQSWQPVGVSAELPRGRTLPVQMMGEEFTLYRGQSGQAYVVAGRCAHRGTLLSTGWVEDDCIRCFYHGWKYESNGQCVEQAVEHPSFADKIRIASYPVYEYLGLIFAFVGEGEPPAPPRYPEFEKDVVVDAASGVFPYNFFNNLENAVDTLHVSWVHRRSNFFAEVRPGEDFDAKQQSVSALEGVVVECSGEETDYGFIFRDFFDNGAERVSYWEMPNCLHIQVYPLNAESGWRDFVSWKVPIDDERYRNFTFTVAYVQGEAAERYRAHPQNPRNQYKVEEQAQLQSLGYDIIAGRRQLLIEDVGPIATSVNLQDFVAQRGQGVIADRQHEHLGKSDRIVILLRKLWSREMQNLADGKPLKQWRWPGYLRTAAGA